MSDRLLRRTVLLLAPVLSATGGCRQREAAPAPPPPLVPRGFTPTLQFVRGEHLYRFGPFVGYYFRPADPDDFSRIEFVCFNERGFYASDMPVGAKLFTGRGVLAELKSTGQSVPTGDGRIQPVFFDDAPSAWVSDRPDPQDEFLHFHSTYDAAGPTLVGYWLSHRAVAEFTYDMGGRVDQTSPLWHRTRPGIDRRFPRIIEFDSGPRATTTSSRAMQGEVAGRTSRSAVFGLLGRASLRSFLFGALSLSGNDSSRLGYRGRCRADAGPP